MPPSIKMESCGLSRGKTSASIDSSNSAGALGNEPRIAWLPTTTMSSASALPAAARMMCSSCGRVTGLKVAQNPPALLGGEDSRKRAGLAEPHGAFLPRCENGEQFVERATEKFLPFEKCGARAFGAVPQPPFEIAARVLDEPRFG